MTSIPHQDPAGLAPDLGRYESQANTHFETASGTRIDLLNPQPSDIDLVEIANGLSRIYRWGGQTLRPISVLEHSLVVAALADRNAELPALLHDAHEYIVGDISRPVEAALAQSIGWKFRYALLSIRGRVDVAIATRVIVNFADEIVGEGGTAQEALYLASEMAGQAVAFADNEAGRLELLHKRMCAGDEGSKGFDASRALRLYPLRAPRTGEMIERWLLQVQALTRARFSQLREMGDR